MAIAQVFNKPILGLANMIHEMVNKMPGMMRGTMDKAKNKRRKGVLEESGGMSGGSWFTVFRRIILPLLKPGLVAGWIYVMIVSIRELSTSILLYSPGNEVISIVIWELWENGQYVELSALSVLFILLLLVLVGIAQMAGKRFGVKDS